ncbi:hypothetical protein D9M68_70900 [compost metagenome]
MKLHFRKDPNEIAKAERIARFKNAIEYKFEIAKIDAGGLVAYVRLIATPLQSRAKCLRVWVTQPFSTTYLNDNIRLIWANLRSEGVHVGGLPQMRPAGRTNY